MVRGRDASTFYLFFAREDKQFAVARYLHGQSAILVDRTPTDAIRPGQVIHLGVTAVGSHFTLSINGTVVASLDDDRITSGKSGVFVEADDPGPADYEFTHFELRAR